MALRRLRLPRDGGSRPFVTAAACSTHSTNDTSRWLSLQPNLAPAAWFNACIVTYLQIVRWHQRSNPARDQQAVLAHRFSMLKSLNTCKLFPLLRPPGSLGAVEALQHLAKHSSLVSGDPAAQRAGSSRGGHYDYDFVLSTTPPLACCKPPEAYLSCLMVTSLRYRPFYSPSTSPNPPQGVRDYAGSPFEV
jgi:hypothetical protein